MIGHDDWVRLPTPRGSEQPRLFEIEPDMSIRGSVYALLMPSHAIKIGWTGRAPRVRAEELHGYLLACRPGTKADEAMFHQRLAAFRIGRTEDFWPAPEVWLAVNVLKLAESV